MGVRMKGKKKKYNYFLLKKQLNMRLIITIDCERWRKRRPTIKHFYYDLQCVKQ